MVDVRRGSGRWASGGHDDDQRLVVCKLIGFKGVLLFFYI